MKSRGKSKSGSKLKKTSKGILNTKSGTSASKSGKALKKY
jgi:hypothetical protein